MTTSDSIKAPTLHERAAALPEVWVDDYDIATLAEVAALALEYAEKVEKGTADNFDITTLVCHCTVLTDDLYELAAGRKARFDAVVSEQSEPSGRELPPLPEPSPVKESRRGPLSFGRVSPNE